MAIAYPQILGLRSEPAMRAWTEKDAILYALGLGFGSDGAAPGELAHVYERELQVVPSFAVVLQRGLGVTAEALGLDYRGLVHGEQSVVLHAPLPAAGAVRGSGRVAAVYDKGPKGAVVVLDTDLEDPETGRPVASCRATLFARRDGNCGAPRDGAPSPALPPDRPPDQSQILRVPENQALIYRLSGDLNPLHVDPQAASAAGFDQPILHGLSTFGMALRALRLAFSDIDLNAVRSLGARFSAPVFLGEAVTFDFWRDDRTISFQARVAERDVLVLKGGRMELAAA
jgi:acyl dehydratase